MEENINIENEYVEETPIVQEEPLVTPAYEMAAEPKKKKNLKTWLIAGIGALVAIAAVVLVLVFLVGNTYKTPITLAEKAANTKKASAAIDKQVATLNGFCEKEYKEIAKILKKSDAYDDVLESYEEQIEYYKEEYGSNYKIKYKITDKDKIDKDELKELQEKIRDMGEEMLYEYEEADSDYYEEIADEMGISESQAKKILKSMESVAKTLKKAKVTEGYTLTVTETIKGSELDEPEEEEYEVEVYKINGRWVSSSAISMVIYGVY
jgi:hypothetical protein